MYDGATVFLNRKKDKFINAFDKLNIQISASYSQKCEQKNRAKSVKPKSF